MQVYFDKKINLGNICICGNSRKIFLFQISQIKIQQNQRKRLLSCTIIKLQAYISKEGSLQSKKLRFCKSSTFYYQFSISKVRFIIFIKSQRMTEDPFNPPNVTNYNLSFLGVIQIIRNNEFEQYALGVYYESSFITLGKYFKEGCLPGKAYFRKITGQEPLNNTVLIDLHEELLNQYYVYQSNPSIQFLNDKNQKIFVEINLIQVQEHKIQVKYPQLIKSKRFDRDNYASGIAIGLKNKDQQLILYAVPFDPKEIYHLNLDLSVGVLLLNRTGNNKTFLYGFYDNLEDKIQGRGGDYFLYEENLKHQQRQQFYKQGHKVVQTFQPSKTYPFNSIGLLTTGGYGTASFLRSKDGLCRYIITCAHNFYGYFTPNKNNGFKWKGYDYTSQKQLKQYSIKLPHRQIPQKPGRSQITQVKKFQIKKVFIPENYKQNIDDSVNKNGMVTRYNVDFPQIPQSKAETIKAIQKDLYDFAIAQLITPLNLGDNIGFRLRQDEKVFEYVNKNKIVVAGFPRSETYKTNQIQVQTIHGIMYHETTEQHDASYVRLSNQMPHLRGERLIQHHLSTLSGNSGSPIYEREENGNCYLFGIHTGGKPTALGQTVLGQYNTGTYIYSKNILQWLKKEVFKSGNNDESVFE